MKEMLIDSRIRHLANSFLRTQEKDTGVNEALLSLAKEIFKNADDLQEKLTRAHLDVAEKMAESAGWEGAYNDLLKRLLETRDSIKLYIFLQNVKGYSIDKNQIDFIFKTHLPELEEDNGQTNIVG